MKGQYRRFARCTDQCLQGVDPGTNMLRALLWLQCCHRQKLQGLVGHNACVGGLQSTQNARTVGHLFV